MTNPSPLVLINSQSQLPNGVNVTDGSTVTIALASSQGVYAWHVECIGTDDANTTTAINATLVVNSANFTATFTAPHSADGYGCALIFKSVVNNGLDINGLLQPYLTTTFGVYVPTFIPTVRLGAQNETIEGNAQYGWLTKFNQAVRAGLFTGGFVNGDVQGPSLANEVIKLQGHTLTVPSPTLNNVLTWNGTAWVDALPQGGTLAGDVNGPAGSNILQRIQGVSVSTPVTPGNVLRVAAGPVTNWAPINLAGGANYVTGLLPTGNQAPQAVGGDLSGTTASATVIGLQTRAVSSAAPTDGYVLTWIAAHNDWEPFPITTGSVTLVGDVTGPANANTVVKFQNRTVVSTAPTDGQVYAWVAAHNDWEPTTVQVTWNDDLLHSTNTDQYVTQITGYPTTAGNGKVGILAKEFDLTTNVFTIQGLASVVGNPYGTAIDIITGDGTTPSGPGKGGDFTVQCGSSSVQSPGNITLTAGNITDGLGGGNSGSITLNAGTCTGGSTVANGGVIYLTPGFAGAAGGADGYVIIPQLATFAYDHVTIDSRNIDSASSMTLNSGTGSTTIYSDDNVNITGSSNVDITTFAAQINLNAKTKTLFQTNSTNIGTMNVDGFGFDGYFQQNNQGASIYQETGSSDGTGLNIIAQGATGTHTGGTLYLGSGYSQSGTAGNVVLKTGMSIGGGSTSGTTQVTVSPSNVTLNSLSGGGNALVSTNNSGTLGIAGAFSGDVSGSWPTLTVTGIHGVTVPGSPSANQVLIATGGSAAIWQLIADANVSATAAISGSKINPNFGIQTLTAGTTNVGQLTAGGSTTLGSATTNNDLIGSLNLTTRTITGNLTIDTTTTDYEIFADTSGGAITITLPAPTNGRQIVIKDKKQSFATNNLTLARHGSEKIDGAASSLVLATNNQEVWLQSDGTDWYTDLFSANPTGAAGGDLSGNYPNPTVAKVNGVAYPSGPSTNTVPVVTGSNTVTYQQIANAQVSSSAAIGYSKLNLSNSIVNADINSSAAIAYAKLNLSNGIVNADINSSAAISISKLAAGTAAQVLLNNATPAPTWTTLSGDVTVSATGATTVNSISGSTPILITPSELQFVNSATPLLDQAVTPANNTPTAGKTFTVKAQTGSNAISGPTNGGNGGLLNLSSGAGGTHTGGGTDGASGDLNLQTGGNTVLTISGSTFGTLAFANSAVPTITQTNLAATNTPTTGASFVLQAQNGSNAISGNTNGGNGAPITIAAGVGGTASGAGTNGVDGGISFLTGGVGRMSIANNFVSISNGLTITPFSTAGVVHNDNTGLLSSSLIVNADISSSAALAVSKLAAGTAGQILLNNSTPTPTWTTVAQDATIDSSGNVTVVGLRTKSLASSLASIGAAQDGYVLTWVNSHSDWEAKPSTGGGGGSVIWADDLVNSSSTDQWVAAISGNAGGGGTVPLHINEFQFDSGQTSPTISQASTSSASGQDLLLQAQGATGASHDGGRVILDGGSSGSSITGHVLFRNGGTDIAYVDKYGLTWVSNAPTPNIDQDPTSSGDATDFFLIAQTTTDSSSAHNGGNLILQSGKAAGGGTDGSVKIRTGSSSSDRIVVDGSGNVRFNHYGAGVVHSDSSGNLTSSNIVNADVDSAAAIAVSKLAAGTNTYVLTTVSGVPTWQAPASGFTAGGDLSGTSSSQTVVAISGTTPIVITPAELQWKNSTSSPLIDQAALASTSSGSGSAGQNLSITAQAGQAATGASHNGGAGGNLVLAGGAGGTSGSATAGASGYVQFSTGTVEPTATKTSDYTLTYADYHVFANFSAGHNLTLPAPVNGLTYHVWDISGTAETNNITLVRNGSEKISGVAASRVLSTNWGHWTIVSNGTDWFVG